MSRETLKGNVVKSRDQGGELETAGVARNQPQGLAGYYKNVVFIFFF